MGFGSLRSASFRGEGNRLLQAEMRVDLTGYVATRTTSGLLRQELWPNLTGWTVGTNFALDSTVPLYVAYKSPDKVLTRPIGGIGSQTIRGPIVSAVSTDLWYLSVNLADRGLVNDKWWCHLHKSRDRGLTWERLGRMSSLSEGSHVSVDSPFGFIDGGDSNIYIFVYATDTQSAEVPESPYFGQIYRIATSTFTQAGGMNDPGTWSHIANDPTLGSGGAFDDAGASPGGPPVLIGGTWHLWYSANDGGSTTTTYTTGHGTFSGGLAGVFSKDGAGANDATAINNNSGTGSRPENPVVWNSTTLGKWVKLTNSVESGGQFTDGSDVYLASAHDTFSGAASYRVRVQHKGKDSVGPIGFGYPVCGTDGLPDEESDGAIGFFFDTNDADDSDNQQNRDIAGGQLDPRPSSVKFTAPTPGTAGTPEYLVRSQSHTDIIIEWECSFADDLDNTYDMCLVYRHNGGTTDAASDAYVPLLRTCAGDPRVDLYRCNAGSFTLLQAITLQPYFDKDTRNLLPNRVRVECFGDTHRVYLNNALLIDITDTSGSKIASGTHLGFRAGGSVSRIHGFAAYTGKSVTINGCPAGAPVTLRGASGVAWVRGVADASGQAVISSDHYPLYGIEVAGNSFPVASGIYGGDVFSIELAAVLKAPTPCVVSMESLLVFWE